MTRDSSDEAYQKMVKQINEINEEQICGFTDAIGDLGLHIGKWSGIIKTESTESYRKKMLDMNNTTVGQLKKIFAKVKSIDDANAKTINQLGERQKVYNTKLKSLSDLIETNVSLPSAEEIKKICSTANDQLKKADTDIKAEYEETLNKMQNDVLLKALKRTTGSFVGMATTIFTMPFKMIEDYATGGAVKMELGAASEAWGLINSTCALASGAVALALLGIDEVFVGITGNTSYRESFLKKAEECADAEGMADALVVEYGETKTTKAIKTASNVIDTVDTSYNVVQDGKDLSIKGKTLLSKKQIPEQDTLRNVDMLQKYQDSGHQHMQNLYNAFERESNVAGALEHVYKYAETAFDANEPGGTADAIRGKVYEESTILKDLKDVVGEIDKYGNKKS